MAIARPLPYHRKPGGKMPYTQIYSIEAPASAPGGSTVHVKITVKNISDQPVFAVVNFVPPDGNAFFVGSGEAIDPNNGFVFETDWQMLNYASQINAMVLVWSDVGWFHDTNQFFTIGLASQGWIQGGSDFNFSVAIAPPPVAGWIQAGSDFNLSVSIAPPPIAQWIQAGSDYTLVVAIAPPPVGNWLKVGTDFTLSVTISPPPVEGWIKVGERILSVKYPVTPPPPGKVNLVPLVIGAGAVVTILVLSKTQAGQAAVKSVKKTFSK
jgi:hypothetical protein